MRTDYTKLKQRIHFVYEGREKEFPKEKSLDAAIKIYKEIKNSERLDIDDKVNYEKELIEAKYDLLIIFGINLKGLSKNEIYLSHQSMWINSIYNLMLKGEL